MLGLTPGEIQQVEGDALGSFWRPTEDALANAPKGSSGWVPERVQREAYSWGGLARTTVAAGGAGRVGSLVAALGRIGWTLLLPFGLTNVAYWTRPLTEPPGTPPAQGAATPENKPATPENKPATPENKPATPENKPATPENTAGTFEEKAAAWGKRRGQGAGTVRLFGLFLTMLLVTTACEVAIDVVGAQCYQGNQVRCTNLPSLTNVFASWGVGPRLALFSAVPVLLLLGLWQLTRISSERYEAAAIGRGRVTEAGAAAVVQKPGTWLTEPVFWDGRLAVRRLTAVHMAAGLLVVTISTAWPAVFASAKDEQSRADACRRLGDLFSAGCWKQVRAVPTSHWFAFCLIVAVSLLALLAAAVVVVRLSGDAPDLGSPGAGIRALPVPLLGVAVVLLLAEVVALVTFRPAIVSPSSSVDALAAPSYLPGVVASPVLLTALLLGLATAGLALRSWPAGWCLIFGFAVALTLLLPVALDGVGDAASLGLAGLLFLLVFFQPRRSAPAGLLEATMWGGRAPGVLLLLALAVAATLSSIVVLTTGDWLNGGRGASDLLTVRDVTNGPLVCNPTTAMCRGPHLSVAAPYVWAGLVAIAFVAVFVLVALGLWLLGRGRLPSAEVDLGEDGKPFAGIMLREGGSVDALRKLQGWAHGTTSRTADKQNGPTALEASLLQQAVGARRTAAYTQRGEILVALFAGFATLAVAGAVILAVTVGPTPTIKGSSWVNAVLDGGVAVITLLGATVIGAVAGGGSATRGRRPLGLAWDLICFLPRTGHPLGPPCYAERAVPEVVRRIEWWLDGEKPDGSTETGAAERRVVLSAHSLGAVLAVAAICATTTRRSAADTLARMSLLTYGSQLRPYFGRLFPELLGPAVQGTAPVAAPTPWGTNPWSRPAPQLHAVSGSGGSVRSLLQERWRNLWRLTDPIGFRVDAPPATPNTSEDRAAEEFDTSTYVVRVDGHSDYPRSLTYLAVLLDAIGVQDDGQAQPNPQTESQRRDPAYDSTVAAFRDGRLPGPAGAGTLPHVGLDRPPARPQTPISGAYAPPERGPQAQNEPRQVVGMSAEIVYRWRVDPDHEQRFYKAALERMDALTQIPLDGGPLQPRLLQPAIGSSPLVWELRIEVTSMKDVGDLLDKISMTPADPKMKAVLSLADLPGAMIVGDAPPFYRVWRPDPSR
jgi:hypothetical protein